MKVSLDYTNGNETVAINIQDCLTQRSASEIVTLIYTLIPLKKNMSFVLHYYLPEDLEKGLYFLKLAIFRLSFVERIEVTCLNKSQCETRTFIRKQQGRNKIPPAPVNRNSISKKPAKHIPALNEMAN